ncbi:HYR domain-containing protein [Ulvibacter litoralis]|uniref:HYR domain-containing protein n=1 Tax=Ulvibacter litoralis TaxID=227084 RepID=A0A1G7FWW1_9FLAO|nr:HYR domain-containing protein [Ulvibacter litoralis]GHC64426.1 hypothetical protein GCM10008083_32090 [Ulvibacter litoralis]SDE80245.1 HYR domain-containing protein [Ulvibacter litoralis]
MKKLILTLLLIVVAHTGNTYGQAMAPETLVPPNLNTGDEFYVMFISNGFYSGNNPSIVAYNDVINSEANFASIGTDNGVNWSAFINHENAGGTITEQTTSLFTANTLAPIYTVVGGQIATNQSDLFDGTIATQINRRPNGTVFNRGFIWTGSDSDGSILLPVSNNANTQVREGSSFETGSGWIDSTSSNKNIFTNPIYGVSELLAVPPDTTPPTAVCQNITVQLNTNGMVTITGAAIDGGSTDNRGIASLDASPNMFDCTNLGSNNVTLTVTDNDGNTATCLAIVTVEDNISPAPICINGLAYDLDATGMLTISPLDLEAIPTTDNCGGIVTLSLSQSTFDCSNLGLNILNLIATDEFGNSDFCETYIIISDPLMACTLPTVFIDASNNLIIRDVDDGRDDAVQIVVDGANYRISDANNDIFAGLGTTQDGDEILVPIASVTGDIQVNTLAGDDVLTVDFSGGNFTDSINYNGGTQTIGDAMSLTGVSPGGEFSTVIHTFVTENNGSINIAGNNTITYTGLEPIIDNLDVANRIFNFTGGAETITLDAGGTLDNQIDSTLGESVDFNNPTNSLTINTEVGGGPGADNINIEGVGAGFDANLTVNSGNDDTVNFLLNPTAIDSGDLTVTTGILNISQDISTTGNIDLTSERNTIVNNNATVSITDGAITMLAGTSPVIGDIYNGILLEDGNLTATTGSITLTGTASNDGASSKTIGVYVIGTSLVETTTGEINITGTGAASGLDRMSGIRINDNTENAAILRSEDGDIILNGTGGSGTDVFNTGVVIDGLNPIQLTGDGSLDVIGQGGIGTESSYGIGIQTAAISVADGSITLNGTAGSGSGDFQVGVSIGFNASLQISGPENMDITGLGGNGVDAGYGITVFNDASLSVSEGAINLIGTAGDGTGNFNIGVVISFGANLETTTSMGTIAINGTGAAGVQNNRGVFLGDTSITTMGGGTSIIGQGGMGTIDATGILIFDTVTIEDTANGAIVLNGTAGAGIQENSGVHILGTIQTLDGAISITGVGNGTANNNQGVTINNTALIESTGTGAGAGSILIDGQAGNGNNLFNIGVLNLGIVRSLDADITIMGQGNGTNNESHGITIFDNGLVQSTGDGDISFTGTGASGFQENIGILLEGGTPRVLSNNGAITFNGFGGAGAVANQNSGVVLEAGATIAASGDGAISLNGTGANAFSGNFGVFIDGTTSSVTSNGGGISMTGIAGNGGGNLNTGIRVNGATITDLSNTGAISLDGTGGSGPGSGNEIGVALISNAIVSSNGGGVSITGAGGSGSGSTAAGLYFVDASITTQDGTIFLNGTGGTAGGEQAMGIASFSSTIVTTNGDIQITGESTDTTGDFNEGIDFIESIIEATNGNVLLDGTSSSATYPGIMVFSANVPIIAGGTITATTAVGSINTPEGIPATAIFEASTTLINGMISPGDYTEISIGQATINGDFDLTSGSLEVKIDGITTPGSDYDQVVVNGVVDVTGATLTLVDNTSETGDLCDEITIINNDAVDAIIGEFAGAAEGTDIPFNGELWRISYTGGDGNDVVLAFNPGFVAAPICMDITLQLDANGTPIIITPANVDGGTPMGCDFASLSIDINTFDCSNVGPNNVVLTVTDIFGNTANCTAIVTVEDNIAPVITCIADGTRDTDAGVCNYTVVGTEFDATFTDNCTSGSISNDLNATATLAGTVLPIGNTTVVWTVLGGNGQMDTCTTVITVEDNKAPVMACPLSITVNSAIDQCGAFVNFNDAIAIDNCGVLSVVQSGGLISGSLFPIGISTVEYTATDINGNSTMCSFTITVIDNVPSVAVCQDITIQLDASGNAIIVASDIDGGSNDNCGIATTTASQTTFDCSDLGPNNVTLTLTDVNGNVSTCIAVVTVEDVTMPNVACMDITVQLDATGTVTITPMDVDGGSTDSCGIVSSVLDIDTFDCSNIGPNNVVLTITDASGNSASCTAVVTVEDNIVPTLVCMDITLELGADGTAMISAADVIASVDDACGVNTTAVDIENFDCSDIGTPVMVIVFAVDNNGNLESCNAIVTVVDFLEPVLTCPADQTVDPGPGNLFYELPDYFALGEATAIDNCTDPIVITTQSPAVGTLLPDGIHTITLTAEDEYGNIGSCTFELTVDSILGVGDFDFDISSIVLHPNPANEYIIVDNPNAIPLGKMMIVDLNGRLIKTIDLKDMGIESVVDISVLEAAPYEVIIDSDQGRFVKRILKSN